MVLQLGDLVQSRRQGKDSFTGTLLRVEGKGLWVIQLHNADGAPNGHELMGITSRMLKKVENLPQNPPPPPSIVPAPHPNNTTQQSTTSHSTDLSSIPAAPTIYPNTRTIPDEQTSTISHSTAASIISSAASATWPSWQPLSALSRPDGS